MTALRIIACVCFAAAVGNLVLLYGAEELFFLGAAMISAIAGVFILAADRALVLLAGIHGALVVKPEIAIDEGLPRDAQNTAFSLADLERKISAAKAKQA
ncbi:hypothetical protein [Frigidibacter sp. MR17.24]|uniref:hypothetical protein n=1 Tax=Frigidibacter sp. MR17.24 TaxID=3127345 RepID=UPI003012E18A